MTTPRLPDRPTATTSDEPRSYVHPVTSALDPRWIMAVRTSEQLQGAVLVPERRERLLQLGRRLGLSAFDASLIIAIVQDQARRGQPAEDCPLAAQDQLALIQRPRERALLPRSRRALLVALTLLGLLAIELVVFWFLAAR